MECEDIINKKFNRSFIGYDIGQVDAFLDELYSEMRGAADEFGFKTETWDGGEFGNGGRTVNRCTLPNRQQNAENKTESASKRVFAPVFSFAFSIYTAVPKK